MMFAGARQPDDRAVRRRAKALRDVWPVQPGRL